MRSLIALLVLTAGASAAEVNAVASFTILADMVARVGGERVAVTSIVGPNADTHVYQPAPTDARRLAGADIFVVNGLRFEGWIERFVEATGYRGLVVVASEGIATRTTREQGETVVDPHAWQDLGNGLVYVANIAAGLCAADPQGCATYEANAAVYGDEIRALDAAIRADFAAIPQARRRVITSHDAFGYFARAYGIAFLAPEGVSTESEASAADVARLVDQIRREQVTALFVETMRDPRLVQQIAAETGLSPGGALYPDALSGKDGPAPTYLDMMRYNAALLVEAMRGD